MPGNVPRQFLPSGAPARGNTLQALLSSGQESCLIGWQVRLQPAGEVLGVVAEVVISAAPVAASHGTASQAQLSPEGRGRSPQQQAKASGSILLRVTRRAELAPHGYAGAEEHWLTLSPEVVSHVDTAAKTLLLRVSKGALSRCAAT